MKLPGLVFLLTFLPGICFFLPVKGQFVIPHIENLSSDTVRFCSDSTEVVPGISIRNITFDEASEGIKISLINYQKGEDTLVYRGDPKFTATWRNDYGFLEIKGIGSSPEYQAAARKVFYKNLAEIPTLGPRSFSITLLDADYLPYTQHFYRFVKMVDISWKEARDSAQNMNYYGLQGYLATITSSIENDFIWSKIDGIGWIGATDEANEGIWKWVTGPEAGTEFWRGNDINGSPVNGRYSYWSQGEPNNAHTEVNNGVGEDYAHINQAPDKWPKSWNDLRNEGDGPNSQYYRPQGFIVEFGGMQGDPAVYLSASAVLSVSKIAFSDLRKFTICEGESKQLNVAVSELYNYSWTPNENINSVSVSNPLVSPHQTTVYHVVGKLGTCVSSADFTVNVIPKPVHNWEPEYNVCKGDSISLDPGDHSSYLWSNLETSRTITVNEEGWYTVKLTNGLGCTSKDSTLVKWSTRPKLLDNSVDSLVCGSKEQQLNLEFETQVSTVLQPMQAAAEVIGETSLSPTIKVDEYGAYSIKMEITDQNQCNYLDTLNIEFHNQPTADFFIDSAKCKGYNITVLYQGTTIEPAEFSWFSNDTVFASDNGLETLEIPLGYGMRNRTVGLKVNEQGCMAENSQSVLVSPKVDFWVDKNAEGCTPLNVKFGNTDIEEIETYSWDFGDGGSSDLSEPSHIYENQGVSDDVFDVSLTVISTEGCENTGVLERAVTVHPIPEIGLSFEEEVCYLAQMQVYYTGSGNEKDTFNWDLSGFGPDEILTNPGTTAGPLEFKLISKPMVEIGLQVTSQFGCKTDLFSRTIERKPLYEIDSQATEGCPPLETEFSVLSKDDTDEVNYTWNFGDEKFETGKNVSRIFNEADKKYDVELVAHSATTGCSDTTILPEEIVVFPVPIASFIADPTSVYIDDPVVDFENLSQGATEFTWNFDDETALSMEESPEHYFNKMGVFDVKLEAKNELGCIDTTIQKVAVVFEKIYPPNAFSPNATNTEDREFKVTAEGILVEGYRLVIFNRWGETIFESQDRETGWDGKMKNGNFAPAGVYTWVVQFNDFLDKKHKQQGTVTLLF